MKRSPPLELDFFTKEKINKPPIFQHRHLSFQGVLSKINPEILKTVMARVSAPNTPEQICDPTLRLGCGKGKEAENAPMTIFYNGRVVVADVSPNKAQEILKIAESSEFIPRDNILQSIKDFTIARKLSVRSFLQKRKERSRTVSLNEYANELRMKMKNGRYNN